MIDPNLEAAIRSSWSFETSDTDRGWDASNPAAGHCDVSSLIVRDRCGGDLKMAKVFRNGEMSEHHYWNVLSDGTEVDVTKEQFDGTEEFVDTVTLDAEFFATAGPIKPSLLKRWDDFRLRVDQHLNEANG